MFSLQTQIFFESLCLSRLVAFGLLCFCVFVPFPCPASQSQHGQIQEPVAATSSLVYVSDYFSFVGQDERGHVAFVLDANRGKDGEEYQSEIFALLHDERQGWIALQGSGSYENSGREVVTIPDSPMFQFEGDVETGRTIQSRSNALSLIVAPLATALSRTYGQEQYRMSSAPATLHWGERIVKGRIIHEYVFMTEFNRLSRTYWGLWKEFQGFYLSMDGVGDLYVHSQQSERLTPLVGKLDGFVSVEGEPERFQVLQLTPLRFSQALGLYRWPVEWSLKWITPSGGGSVILELSEFHRVSTWVIGGFAMGIVSGKASYQGKTFNVYGLVELIM
ncbi:MAG: hypothetical protein KC594_11345 [Nitrospira sp.]|nr:hypothetical protein [Nitrospira sp.]